MFAAMMIIVALPAAAGDRIEQTGENLAQIKERLDQRGKDLEAEWAALQQEKAELDRIARGGTLRGGKKNKYMQRNTEYNDRMMKYQVEKEKLRQDIETYNAAAAQMSAAVSEGVTTGGDKGTTGSGFFIRFGGGSGKVSSIRGFYDKQVITQSVC